MNEIQQVTSDTLQRQTIPLADGTTFSLTIYFIPLQQGWFITNLTYGDFVLQGFRICNSPNILHQFKNRIPFGIACFSDGDREPSFQEDFLSGASKLYLLTEAEVDAYTEFLSG